MRIPNFIKSRRKEIPFLILLSLLGTFIISRLTTYLFPQLTLTVRGEHIHHFAYGIILLALSNLLSLLLPQTTSNQLRLSVLYGISLGLAFDEFAMWIRLEDAYWSRANFDAVVVVSLVFLNIIYFDGFWTRWGKRLHRLIITLFSFTQK